MELCELLLGGWQGLLLSFASEDFPAPCCSSCCRTFLVLASFPRWSGLR